ncbi:MAG: DUF2783 domain-containing protein [Candidatus Competibacteraceae bacterium]|nr:DUF2783 domain-containing protein [Candidatus Competibacteraceae bacterium]MCB1810517.1 DUF2783 domain-containing protein [Candidatus Competibacteraceae bacterium]
MTTIQSLSFDELEEVYELFAAAVDTAGADKETLLLSKLCLTLAYRLGDFDQVEEALRIAEKDLDR